MEAELEGAERGDDDDDDKISGDVAQTVPDALAGHRGRLRRSTMMLMLVLVLSRAPERLQKGGKKAETRMKPRG